MDKKLAEVLYYLAEDFVKLNYLQKFNMGVELGFVRVQEFELTEEEIEERVFGGMFRKNQLSEFVVVLYKVMHE